MEERICKIISDEDKKLLRLAKTIDYIDAFLGPLESLMQVYGSPAIQSFGFGLSVLELVLFKIPFAYNYLSQTQDYNALSTWLPREVFAATLPFGGAIDISRMYYRKVNDYVESKEE